MLQCPRYCKPTARRSGQGAHRHVGVAAQVEGGEAGEDGHVGGGEGALQVEAAHVQAQQRAVGGADLPWELAPVGEHAAAGLLRVARLPVGAHGRGAGAAAAQTCESHQSPQ